MADDRRGMLLVGALTVVMGAALFLAAGDVIPLPDEMFGAPREIVALFALGFLLGGAYVLSLLLPTPRMRRLLGAASGLALITGAAVLLTWHAHAGRAAVPALSWAAAALANGLALAAWLAALRGIVRRRPP